jgi:cytochrome c biogenesis protein CcmG/thiol:disulfide interchange protein DsbE
VTARGQLGVVAAVVVIVAVAAVVLHGALRQELEPLGAGTTAPPFHAMTLDTPPAQRSLADYRGQVVLVNVWATWCVPCRVEMPSIERLYRQFGPEGLRVAAISEDDPGSQAAIRAFVQKLGLTFDILYDPSGSIRKTYQVTGYPETVIVGRDGIIRKKIAGATDWDSEGNRRVIAGLLAERD